MSNHSNNSKINRRQFIKGVSVAGLLPFIPVLKTNLDNYPDIPPDNNEYIKQLIKVLNEDSPYLMRKLSEEEIDKMTYAFNQIKPTNHQELAYVVACSICLLPLDLVKIIADEYVRRRSGEKAALPDHPILDIKEYGMPDTYRILIYKEQMEALLRKITGQTSVPVADMHRKIRAGMWYYKDLLAAISKENLELLSTKEIETIDSAISVYRNFHCPYSYCSTVAARVYVLPNIPIVASRS